MSGREAIDAVLVDEVDRERLRVLVLEDNQDDAELIVRALRADGLAFDATVVSDEGSYRQALRADPDVIISDYHLRGFDGRKAVEQARALGLDAPFILVSGVLREEEALELFRHGVSDYLLKDRLVRLGAAVRHAVEQRDLRRRDLEAAEAVRRSEQRFRSLVQNGAAVIATSDATGTITYISPTIERLTGLPVDHYLGTSIVEHVHPEDDAPAAFRQTVAEPGSVITDRRRIARWDGEHVWVECTRTNLLHDPDVGAVTFNFFDVTAQQQAMDAVTASEERYRRIVEGTHEAILVIDPGGAVTFANRRADELFDVPPGGLLTRTVHELVEEPVARAVLLGADGSGPPAGAEPDPDGRVEVQLGRRWVSVAADVLWDGAGEVAGRLILATDVTENRRAEAQARMQAHLLDSVGEAVFALDREGTVIYWNPAATAMFGPSAEQMAGGHVLDVVSPTFASAAQDLYGQMQHGTAWSGELTLARRDGSRFPALMSVTAARGDDDEVIGTLFVVVDLTDRHAAAAELAARARQQSAVAAFGAAALATRDPLHLVQSLLETAAEQLGVDRPALFQLADDGASLVLRGALGVPAELLDSLTAPIATDRMLGFVLEQQAPVAAEDFGAEVRFGVPPHVLEQGLRSGVAVVVGEPERPWGILAVGCTRPRPYTQNEVDFVSGLANVFAGAVERRAAERQLERLALHDPLTGLANRTSFEDRGAEELERHRSGQVALLLLEARSLKLINDALGHAAVEAVLRSLAARLVEDAPDALVLARLSNDVFAALVEVDGADAEQAAVARAEQMVRALAPAHDLDEGSEVFAPVAVGVAVLGPSEAAGEMAMQKLERHADLALQQAKRGARDVELFDRAGRDDAATRLTMATALRGAAAREELLVRYQPEVPLRPGAPLWAEALVRWQHPDLGLVEPDRFIPVAEESGSIIDVGSWVLREVCRQVRRWHEDGAAAPAVVAVNLSPRQLAHPDLVSSVADALAAEGVPPSSIAFEITETAVMADPVRALDTVRRLRELGMVVAIDDFGTGYSSLALLQEFPVGALKVDRSFVAGVVDHESDRSIVAAVLGLARALDLLTVAEGVETEAQRDALVAMGCDVGQGYLWAKPMPPDDLVRWVAAYEEGRAGSAPA